MLDSLYIGMTGLQGFSKGLKVISNNTTNLNTPGFKSTTQEFSNLSNSNGQAASGNGVNAYATSINFKQGELRQTSNDLDLAINGQGLFTLKDANGKLHYTRDGQFQFNEKGVLVNSVDKSKVMALDTKGNLNELSINSLKVNPGKATSSVKFNGNLSSTANEQVVEGINVFDAVGGQQTLTAKFINDSATTPGSWKVTLLNGTTTVGTGSILFANGLPDAARSVFTVNYTVVGQKAIPITLDFSNNVTSFASGDLSTLASASQDGYAPGALTKIAFDESGTLITTYANGQTSKGQRLALGRADSQDALVQNGSNQFDVVNGTSWHVGYASSDAFGSVQSGMVEISNVDLSEQFSDLVIMQRGYQASSQIVSTANEMLQELFNMKGK